LTHSEFIQADLRYSNLSDSDLTWVILIEADLRGANLRNACLKNCCLNGADLRGADLEGADLEDITAYDTHWELGIDLSLKRI
jgi:uncharacterized protein YjbI with pentapeptide repeats